MAGKCAAVLPSGGQPAVLHVKADSGEVGGNQTLTDCERDGVILQSAETPPAAAGALQIKAD